MAQKVNIELISDISEKPADETVTFGLDGTSYEIDLTSKEADAFRGYFQEHISRGRKVKGGNGRKANGSKAKASDGGTSAAEIRAWAQSNGHDVPERGRIPATVREAYEAAN